MFKEIAFTAYAVSDIKKAREFYEGVLGLKPNGEFDKGEDTQFVEYNIGSGTLAIGCAPGMWNPSEDGASVALEVNDFDAALALIKEKNIPVKMGPHDFPTCQMIVIQDPDKNRIALHKKKAK